VQFCNGLDGGCSSSDKFTINIGELSYTVRYNTGMDYIFHPEQDNSIQVTGEDLDSAIDRIMVIDCQGTCGINSETHLMKTDGTVVPLEFADPRIISDCCPELDTSDRTVVEVEYWSVSDRYCSVDWSNMYDESITDHYCKDKCLTKGRCQNADICTEGKSCDGFLDEIDSVAYRDDHGLCADYDTCQSWCDGMEDCHSFAVHAEYDRCYLYTNSCSNMDWWILDTSYNLYVKQTIIPPQFTDSSVVGSDTSLEFPAFHLPMGTFKVCACDHELLGSGVTCRTKSDYSVELGRIHVSGTSCMFTRSIQSRRHCHAQPFGGLRCDDEPEVILPPDHSGQFESPQTGVDVHLCPTASDDLGIQSGP